LNYGTNFGKEEKVSLMLQQVLNSEEVKQVVLKKLQEIYLTDTMLLKKRAK
jgi:hypothetical protein